MWSSEVPAATRAFSRDHPATASIWTRRVDSELATVTVPDWAWSAALTRLTVSAAPTDGAGSSQAARSAAQVVARSPLNLIHHPLALTHKLYIVIGRSVHKKWKNHENFNSPGKAPRIPSTRPAPLQRIVRDDSKENR